MLIDGPSVDNPIMIVKLDSKRRLTVPASLASASPGEYFDVHFDPEEDAIIFRRLTVKKDWLGVSSVPSAWMMCLLADVKLRVAESH